MAGKFHITENGPRPCKAFIRACKYGDHYPTEKHAEIAYAEQHESFATLSKQMPEVPEGYFAKERVDGTVFEGVNLSNQLNNIVGFVSMDDEGAEALERLRKVDAVLELHSVSKDFQVEQVLAGEAQMLSQADLSFYSNDELNATYEKLKANIYDFKPINEHQKKFHRELVDAVIDSRYAAMVNSGVIEDPMDKAHGPDVAIVTVNAPQHIPGLASDYDAGWATSFVQSFERLDRFGLDEKQNYDVAVQSYLEEERSRWQAKYTNDENDFNYGAKDGLDNWLDQI